MGERSGAPRASALHQSSFRNLRLRFNYRSQMSRLTVTHPKNWLEAHRYLNMNDLREHKKTYLRGAA